MTRRSRVWLARLGLAGIGLSAGTLLGHLATATSEALGPEHAVGLAVGVLVSLWIASDR